MFYSFFEKVYDWFYGQTYVRADYDKVMIELQEKFATKETDAPSELLSEAQVVAESPTNDLEFALSISALGFDSQDEEKDKYSPCRECRCCMKCDYMETMSWKYESSCDWLMSWEYESSDWSREDIPPHIVKTIEAWDRTKERRDNEYEKKKRKKQNLTARRFAKQLYKKSISNK